MNAELRSILALACAGALLTGCATPPTNEDLLREPVLLTLETTKSVEAYANCLQERWNAEMPVSGTARYPTGNTVVLRDPLADTAVITPTATGAKVEYREPAGWRMTALNPAQQVKDCK
ncbi:hypothetical protein [Cupriavidus metallidurans]|uniref:hypothetical protein n=1 Tax=Cupriavidus metallidurans TaxID=119219 RepID=UPI001CCD7940|nr:hypothetical protein [Cupriavidus metallidurans]UBM12783.1 hypothetical protein LAI70_27915 [Cupriavidus metallidurans]